VTSHRSRLSRLVKATSHFISSSFHLLPECYAIVGLEGEVTCRHDNVICDGVLRVKITELAELDQSQHDYSEAQKSKSHLVSDSEMSA